MILKCRAAVYAWCVPGHGADGVLITGVYGSGKSSVGVVAHEVMSWLGWL